jgi:membrane-associated phospholipid phosphatase
MHFLTDFADQAVVLPFAMVIGLIFLAVGWVRGAVAWCVAICGTLATMLALKLCMLACGWRWPVLEIHSPSGHAASAAVIYGGLLSLALPRVSLWQRILVILAPTVIIAITRVYIGAHSVPEVISGGAVGLTGALVLTWLAGERPPYMPRRKLRLLVGAAGVVTLIALHGQHLPAEMSIQRISLHFWPMSACTKRV